MTDAYLENVKAIRVGANAPGGFLFDFTLAWQWAGYANKSNAAALVSRKCGFLEDVDYSYKRGTSRATRWAEWLGDRDDPSPAPRAHHHTIMLLTFDALCEFIAVTKGTKKIAFARFFVLVPRPRPTRPGGRRAAAVAPGKTAVVVGP
jgi:hypothetical protein